MRTLSPDLGLLMNIYTRGRETKGGIDSYLGRWPYHYRTLYCREGVVSFFVDIYSDKTKQTELIGRPFNCGSVQEKRCNSNTAENYHKLAIAIGRIWKAITQHNPLRLSLSQQGAEPRVVHKRKQERHGQQSLQHVHRMSTPYSAMLQL